MEENKSQKAFSDDKGYGVSLGCLVPLWRSMEDREVETEHGDDNHDCIVYLEGEELETENGDNNDDRFVTFGEKWVAPQDGDDDDFF